VLILFLVWQIVRYVSKYHRSMQFRIDSANQQLHKEFQVMESERTRIAKDLHDDLGPLLSAVAMRMNCIQPSRDADYQHVHTMRQYLSDAIERLGIISYNLSPLAIERKGLQAALQEFFYYYRGSTEVEIEFVYEVKTALPPNDNLQIYRIIQEIVHNGMKHSQASQIQVCLLETEGMLTLLYGDNGIGFDPDKAMKSGGRGIGNVKSRIEMLGGKMTLDAAAGRGVEYTFQLPLWYANRC
jgi:signal transduction histidine kinase